MENKQQFVEELSQVLSKHFVNIGVEKLEYFKPGKTYTEEVIITYTGGYRETVNVTFDSCVGILRDICKQGFRS